MGGGGWGGRFILGSAIVGCGLYSIGCGSCSRFSGLVDVGSGLVAVCNGGVSGIRGGLSLGSAMVGLGLYFGLGAVVFSGCSCLGLSGLWFVWLGVT